MTMTTNPASAPTLSWQPQPQPAILLPKELFDRYISEAIKPAAPRKTTEGSWYCALDNFPGVWAEGASLKECLDVLEEVLKDWLIVKLVNGDTDLPVVDDIDLTAISQRF